MKTPTIARRDFVKLTASTAAMLALRPSAIMAGPFPREEFERLIPSDKKLNPDWVKSLFARGERAVYRWPEAKFAGMPVGGICSGQVYLGGDGKLWYWDIFNRIENTGSKGPHYADPLVPALPFAQGFALQVERPGAVPQTRSLDHTAWGDIRFRGEYPIGIVEYRDPDCPVTVELEAFSPFVPLDAKDSALPVTILNYTVRNTSGEAVKIRLAGWLENATHLNSGRPERVTHRNRVARDAFGLVLSCDARVAEGAATRRADIVFEDFEKDSYEGWEAVGSAFGKGPIEQDRLPAYQGKVESAGRRLVNSHASAPGSDAKTKDSATGRLKSRPFKIERSFITFLVGGGKHKGKTCVNLLIEGKTVLSETGPGSNTLKPCRWDVRKWAGQNCRIEIVDDHDGGWGNIGVDHFVFTDEGGPSVALIEERDAGTMALAIVAGKADAVAGVPAVAAGAEVTPEAAFAALSAPTAVEAERPWGETLCGALGQTVELAAGTAVDVMFAVCWHFPNLNSGLPGRRRRHYAARFTDASAVMDYVVRNRERLTRDTRLWRDTWYDSSLPFWFLDRTLATAAHLATNTCVWHDTGRFYAWEGVGCCPGTCTHVWHYAQAVGRLFPELERSLRQQVDFGPAFDPKTGSIGFRGELIKDSAIDGQAGVILRTLREHQMSATDAFLRRVWPRAKKALEFLISRDVNDDGIIEGPQHNTLDADWFGLSSWLSGMYIAALRAGEEMSREMGDNDFARKCRAIFDKGRLTIDEKLFNGEYYVHEPDPKHRVIGSYNGCHIDQVLGQGWAWQVGLGRVHAEAQTRSALRSLWRYNFAPDVGPFRKANERGRWYALAGEGGLLMCTWPRGESQRVRRGPDGYFNECMSGFEHQAASHMIAEGMVMEGLAVTRAIHDRYHPSRRNPWNEIECGDHYGRALASYGTYLAACGFEYHGPKGHIGFAPRLNPDDFRCAFTVAEGWGTFSQKAASDEWKASIMVKWGRLRLRTLALNQPAGAAARKTMVMTGGKGIPAEARFTAGRVMVTLAQDAIVTAGEILEVSFQ